MNGSDPRAWEARESTRSAMGAASCGRRDLMREILMLGSGSEENGSRSRWSRRRLEDRCRGLEDRRRGLKDRENGISEARFSLSPGLPLLKPSKRRADYKARLP